MDSNPRDAHAKAAVPGVASIIEDHNDSTMAASLPPSSSSTSLSSAAKNRRDLFGDCALVEIIHLHDCLRGALKALENDVNTLTQSLLLKKGVPNGRSLSELSELERRVVGRFKVIWSVFKAHSSAEDEFIWPTLQLKTQGRIKGSPSYRPGEDSDTNQSENDEAFLRSQQQPSENEEELRALTNLSATETMKTGTANPSGSPSEVQQHQQHNRSMAVPISIEQEEYEEDHADEERMFSTMDGLLTKLRSRLVHQTITATSSSGSSSDSLDELMKTIHDLTKDLSRHLMAHLEKEEKQCMPLVVKHLTKTEIHDLVGKIMGKRSSDLIAQIMTMAVQNLEETDREEMVRYMQQAMAGTFFDRWLTMSGWMNNDDEASQKSAKPSAPSSETTTKAEVVPLETTGDCSSPGDDKDQSQPNKRLKTTGEQDVAVTAPSSSAVSVSPSTAAGSVTSQAELENLIRAIVSNPNLTSVQKNTTIQGLRDSVWKSNQRLRRNYETQVNDVSKCPTGRSNSSSAVASPLSFAGRQHMSSEAGSAAVSATCTPARRVTPPTMYYKKNREGKVEIVWNSDGLSSRCPADGTVPLFSASELAPSYHDGATGAVLGCPHYARACKLRHPESGRLYTCRLCCEQERELPMKDKDSALDRYAVSEVMCMKCHTLQPADDRCLNPGCESRGKPYAKYFCRICHLYDDRPNPIFHCPFCNTCRMGLGLGIDFRHCMRCNACVSLSDDEHRCIPQKLQGSCPICHESLFESTESLKGLRCGHVMHLSCFTQYRRGHRYTCPLCMRSMEDMSDYFALLDAAVRMQPMPAAYLSTVSNIYCQDCSKTGQCPYHFVGQKCPHCGSYNVRELGRVHI